MHIVSSQGTSISNFLFVLSVKNHLAPMSSPTGQHIVQAIFYIFSWLARLFEQPATKLPEPTLGQSGISFHGLRR